MKKASLIMLSVLLYSFTFSQSSPNLGLLISADKFERMSLQYRLPIKEKLRLNVSGTFGWENKFGNAYVTSFNDSVINFQRNNSNKQIAGLKIGIDRRLKESIFSIGTDLIFRYTVQNNSILDEFIVQDSTTFETNSYVSNFNSIENAAIYKTYGWQSGIQLSIKADIPINEKFKLNLYTSITGIVDVNSSVREISDPNNKFDTNNWVPNSIIEISATAGVGLFYSL